MFEVIETTSVEAPREVAFEFFRRPHDVLAISDPSVGASLRSGPEILSFGDRVELTLVAFGMPRDVVNEISEMQTPSRFVEEQVEGPLKSYWHEHRFEAEGSKTTIIDTMRFEPPGGLAGLLMPGEKIAEHLADSIAYRNRQLPEAIQRFAVTLPAE